MSLLSAKVNGIWENNIEVIAKLWNDFIFMPSAIPLEPVNDK